MSVAYTGCGFAPTALLVYATAGDIRVSLGMSESAATDEGGNLLQVGVAGTWGSNTDNTLVSLYTAGLADLQTATLGTWDSDGFTLAWTKTGSPTGTGTLLFMCMR